MNMEVSNNVSVPINLIRAVVFLSEGCLLSRITQD